MDAPSQRKGGNLPETCAHLGCERDAVARIGGQGHAYCHPHWHRKRRGTDMDDPIQPRRHRLPAVCEHPGCKRPARSRLAGSSIAYCQLHRRRKRDGIPLDAPNQHLLVSPYPIGAVMIRQGYSYVKISTGNGGRQNWVRQHRRVMEQKIGRSLSLDETVHHVNGDRGDNRIENLELWSSSQPAGQRVSDKVEWAHEIIARYDPTLDGGQTTRAPIAPRGLDATSAR